MKQNVEYQIIIGCNDSYSKDEYVKHDELSEVIIDFFERKEVDFSLLKQEGGYLCDDGNFILEGVDENYIEYRCKKCGHKWY